jgi:hypothetical protein
MSETEGPPHPENTEDQLLEFDRTSVARALFVGGMLSTLAAALSVVLVTFVSGHDGTAIRGLGFGAFCLSVAALCAIAYDWYATRREHERGLIADKLLEPHEHPRASEGRVSGRWRRAQVVLGLAGVGLLLSLVATGVAFASGEATAVDSPPTALRISWAVEEPLRVVTPASPVIAERPARIALRVTDPGYPGCGASYHWTVGSRQMNELNTCTVSVELAPGHDYQVDITRVGASAATGHDVIHPKRLLVVSFGDSVASGEGNPSPGKPKWADSTSCNRSTIAGPRQAAHLIAAAVHKSVVTFLHLACTGAWIDGVGAPLAFGHHPHILTRVGETEPSQLDQYSLRPETYRAEQVIVLLSVGANDVGFGPILRFCLNPLQVVACYRRKFDGFKLDSLVASRLSNLQASYDRLASKPPFSDSKVFVTEYFDPLHGANGQICRLETISRNEASWADRTILAPLNALVAEQARVHGWTLVSGIWAAFRPHGYCATQSWIRHLSTSLLRWNLSGPFHPNELGQAEYGELIFDTVRPYLDGQQIE